MKKYEWYVEKASKAIKHVITTVDAPFDKAKVQAIEFLKYMKLDQPQYIKDLADKCGYDLMNVELEDVFPNSYMWFVKDIALKSQIDYINNLDGRIKEFQGKENTLRVMLCLFVLRMAILNSIVESIMAKVADLVSAGVDPKNITLSDIGMGKNVLKYIDDYKSLDGKSIDDWLATNIDEATFKYVISATKRILAILQFNK